MNYFKIAWRNLWRNKRRTAITSSSILFAVFFALIMRAFQLGFYDHMIKNAIESFSGFLQIQNKDFEEDPSLDNTFVFNKALFRRLEAHGEIKTIVPRIEVFSLASSGEQTKGALVAGIDPDKEKGLSDPAHRIVKYRITPQVILQLKKNKDIPDKIKEKLKLMVHKSYTSSGSIAIELELNKMEVKRILPVITEAAKYPGVSITADDDGVLVSDRLSRFLKLDPGDSVVLLGPGYHGTNAAGLYVIRGVIKVPNPELDNKLIYMPIKKAQQYCDLGDRVSTLAINLHDNSDKTLYAFQKELNQELEQQGLVVKNWKEFNQILKQQIQSDNQSGQVMLALLYFIIFFGIFGTVLMMIHERYREFGVLVSIGMKKTRLAVIMLIEMFFMGLLGIFSGTVLSIPILYYYHNNPIRLTGGMAQMMEDMGFEAVMPISWIDSFVLWQGIIVSLMVVLSCIYPLRKVFKLKEGEALRGI